MRKLPGDASPRTNFRNAQLLIIEDDPDHGLIIEKAIRQCLPEVKPVLVGSKEEALAQLEQYTNSSWKLLKLILLDLYLPGRDDGWAILETINQKAATHGKVPVVLLSYSDNPSDVEQAYDLGCASYVVKPSGYPEWITYFETFRTYWWETVVLPGMR